MEEKEIQEQTQEVEEVASEEVTSQDGVAEEQKTEANVEEVAKVTEEAVSEPKKRAKKVKKEKPQESYEGLSDDEIYTRMQTEKLVERKKKRKIITAVAMGVAFVFAFVIIILATVPVSLKPHCIDNNYTEAKLYNGTNIDHPVAAIPEDDARFKEFKKVFDKSFAQSCLSGIFSGSVFTYDIEEHQYFSAAMHTLTSANPHFLKLTYAKERKVTKQNGKVFKSDAWTKEKISFSFSEVYIALNTEAGFRNTSIVIPVSYPNDDNEYAIVITVKANTNRFEDAWATLVPNNEW